jgi:hypothetical protein
MLHSRRNDDGSLRPKRLASTQFAHRRGDVATNAGIVDGTSGRYTAHQQTPSLLHAVPWVFLRGPPNDLVSDCHLPA